MVFEVRAATTWKVTRTQGYLIAAGALALSAMACGGGAGTGPENSMDPNNPNGGGSAGTDPVGGGGTSGTGGGLGGSAGDGIPPGGAPTVGDPGTTLIHRLNSFEYNNTVQDLLGTTLAPATANWFDGTAGGFDVIAETHRVDDAQYERYFNAAVTLVDDVFANPALVASIVTCATQDDVPCVQSIIQSFGTRAFRRPLSPEEITTYSTVYTAARGQGEDHTLSIKQVVRAMLSSAEFLFRIETDPLGDTTSHLLTSHDLASRLSYFLWASMPDATLFGAAADNTLLDAATLDAQVDRLLADPKSARFVQSFVGQWLGVRKVATHTVVPTVYPDWNPALANSMMTEAYSYFAEFLGTERPWSDFLRADFNYVDTSLANLYGVAAPAGPGFVRVENVADDRFGFLGLSAFLTLTSYEHRTSPTLRARWILTDLLCTPPPPPPPDVPEFPGDESPEDAANMNIRDMLEQHRVDPGCAGCHAVFDPFGLALENFDGIGRFRTQYPNGDAIDASGTFPDGTAFTGLAGMVEVALARPGFNQCVVEKSFVYGLGRLTRAGQLDEPYLANIEATWQASAVPSLKTLIKTVVASEPFRYRHGTAP
jgi:hypothetical protein